MNKNLDSIDNDVQLASEGTGNVTINTVDKLQKLISCQNFDGSFKLESVLAQLLNTTLEDIKQAAEKNLYSEQVWATAVALAFMKIALADLQTEWMLVAPKAENWIRSSGKLTGDETACANAAQEYVKAKLHL